MEDTKDYLQCEDCGQYKEDVCETICPYCEDIHGEIVEVILCNDCCNERAMDI